MDQDQALVIQMLKCSSPRTVGINQSRVSNYKQGHAIARVSAVGDHQEKSEATVKSQDGGAPLDGVNYYKGLITSDIREDNGSSSQEMLGRNLKLAGGVAGFLLALILGFMASNGLL